MNLKGTMDSLRITSIESREQDICFKIIVIFIKFNIHKDLILCLP